MFYGAQLFEGRYFFFFKNNLSENFLCYFYEHPIINLLTK